MLLSSAALPSCWLRLLCTRVNRQPLRGGERQYRFVVPYFPLIYLHHHDSPRFAALPCLPLPPNQPPTGDSCGGGDGEGGRCQRGAAHLCHRGSHPKVRACRRRLGAGGAISALGNLAMLKGGGAGGSVDLWDQGAPLWPSLQCAAGQRQPPVQHPPPLPDALLRTAAHPPLATTAHRLAASPCGCYVAGYGQDGTIHVWTAGERWHWLGGNAAGQFEMPAPPHTPPHPLTHTHTHNPILPDLADVVTRVGLTETELDLVDSLGVSNGRGWAAPS